MVLRMYAVWDSKTEAFMQPFFMAADGQATRALQDAVNDGKEMIAKHPEDFSLYFLATFNDADGTVTFERPTQIVQATALVQRSGGHAS